MPRIEKLERVLYKFDELPETIKEKAIQNLSDINVDHYWYPFTYEDAKQAGLKITSFDLDRNRHARGDWINSAPETAEYIISNHGKERETYKTAEGYLAALKSLDEKYPYENIEDRDYVYDDERAELDDEFLKSLLEDYSIILQKESEYLQSEEAITEAILANDYEFTLDGKIA